MNYKCKYFTVREVFSPRMINTLPESELWKLMDVRQLITMDSIKENTGWTLICNTYFMSDINKAKYGNWNERGYRCLLDPTGKKAGAHPKGMACDLDAYDKQGFKVKAEDMRQHIITNRTKYPYIAGIEAGVNWLHADVLERPGYVQGKICLFNVDGTFKWI